MAQLGNLQVWMAVFLALSLYAVVELNIIILTTFKSRRGLYFWSFVIATNGIAPYSISIMLRNLLHIDTPGLYVTLTAIGWVSTVTGQSLVLYSRLHLVVPSPRCLRLVLSMIVIDAFLLHVPKMVLLCISIDSTNSNLLFAWGVFERVQTAGFFLQELIISGLYIKNAFAFFPLQGCMPKKGVQKMRNRLQLVNVLVIAVDIVILVTGMVCIPGIVTSFRAFAYSVKLKLEFSVLNSLVELAHQGVGGRVNLSIGPPCNNASNPGVHLDNLDGVAQSQEALHRRNQVEDRHKTAAYVG